MQIITRKTLAVLLSVLLLCAMLPMTVFAAGEVLSKDFEDGKAFFSSDCGLEVVEDGGSKVLYWHSNEKDWANIYTYVNVSANTDYTVSY